MNGERLEGQEWQTTQDFVLIDDEQFFTGDLAMYQEMNDIVADGTDQLLAGAPVKPLAKLIAAARLGLVDGGKLLIRLKKFTDQRPASPLWTDYFSCTPYQLGQEVVKYKAVCPQPRPKRPDDVGPNYLADALKNELGQRGASFDFGVHVQGDGERHPIDDPHVSWSEAGAAWSKLATITIRQQVVDRHSEVAEGIVYSPWHCLAAHQPRGKINLARRQVYAALAPTRHADQDIERSWANMSPDKRQGLAAT